MKIDKVTCEFLLDIKNLRVENIEIGSKELHVYCRIELDSSEDCPQCGAIVQNKRPKYERVVRDLDISGRKVYLHLIVHQYQCDCGRTFSEFFDFVDNGKSYTKRQSKYIFELCKKQSHLEVAAIVDMSHKTVERLFYQEVENRIKAINWKKVNRIGIDEFSFKKGKKDYIVVIVDLDTHEILDILESRCKSFIRLYFKELEKHCSGFLERVKEFCSDMWGPFQDLGKELFKNALIHIDRFHWTSHLNKALDSYRKSLRRKNKDEDSFKKLKWKVIKRVENLTKQEQLDLEKAFEKDDHFRRLYHLRNDLQKIFDRHISSEIAELKVNDWLSKAVDLNDKYLNKFIELFNRHRKNIMNYFKTRLSSAAVEGKNNLLRTVKRFTFNMTNFNNFKARVLAYSF